MSILRGADRYVISVLRLTHEQKSLCKLPLQHSHNPAALCERPNFEPNSRRADYF